MKNEFDYQKLGFKCGLEIHQQIAELKLFCKCPSLKIEGPPDYQIKRYLRAVAGEAGEIDAAAKFETGKKKYFLYEGHHANTCLLEIDETPPFSLNESALETALEISLLLNAKIVDEILVMRKIVVDGSNVSGFQRTALIAVNGCIETQAGSVRIPTICLEEEAAQKLEETDEYVKYKLDRLGIPLIEIATDASIKNPKHAMETAAYLGMVLRSVRGIKRGLGTIRQDVNVSIDKGARTEIKGFQDLRSIPKVIAFEIQRQLHAIHAHEKISPEVRKAEPDFTTTFLRPMPGAARMYPETDAVPVAFSKKYIEAIKKNLPKLLVYRVDEFKKRYKLSDDVANEIVELDYFEDFVTAFRNIEPSFIAQTVITTPKEIRRRYELDPAKLTPNDFKEVLGYLNEGKITKGAVIDVLIEKLMGEKINLAKYAAISDAEVEAAVAELVKEKPGLSVSGYMGLLMAAYKGKVEGRKIMELLKKYCR